MKDLVTATTIIITIVFPLKVFGLHLIILFVVLSVFQIYFCFIYFKVVVTFEKNARV